MQYLTFISHDDVHEKGEVLFADLSAQKGLPKAAATSTGCL